MNISEPVTFYYILTFTTSSIIILLAVMLFGIHIPIDEKLSHFRLSRKYLALSYFILGLSGFGSFFSQKEANDAPLLATLTLIVASYQALLFTYTILALIQPLYVKRKPILSQLGIITTTGALLFLALLFFPHTIFSLVLYTAVFGYFFQLSFYTYIFRLKYKACLNTLENFYEEDEHVRLRWVKWSFYSALGIGILALISLFANIYLYSLFTVLYTTYYTYMVCRFYNYQINFGFAIPVITKNGKIEKNKETSKDVMRDKPNETLVKSEQFKRVLDKWIKEKKFTQKDIGVDEIAESLGVDHRFLQYYFRTYMETDFRTWRSKLRIEEAQLILDRNPETSLEKVRELVGFNHRANFHQQFQKVTGMTPTEYKLQHLKLF